jgi:hypothetical protein
MMIMVVYNITEVLIDEKIIKLSLLYDKSIQKAMLGQIKCPSDGHEGKSKVKNKRKWEKNIIWNSNIVNLTLHI